jgi:hypothetical protein
VIPACFFDARRPCKTVRRSMAWTSRSLPKKNDFGKNYESG